MVFQPLELRAAYDHVTRMSNEIWSPCIKVCFVDPAQQVCIGCFRRIEELGRWTRLSHEEREAIRPKLEERKAAYLAKRWPDGAPPSALPQSGSRSCGTARGDQPCEGPQACEAMGLDCPALRG